MKNKIIYSFILIFLVSLIASAKKITDCNASPCCQSKQNSTGVKPEGKTEPATLSLFFFNI